MRRYWLNLTDIEPTLALGQPLEEVQFKGDLFHHIFEVCRLDVGSKFEVIAPDSKAYLVEVLSRQKKSALAKVLESRLIAHLEKPFLILNLALSKFPVMDAVIEKAVELGVHTLRPFYSEYSFLRKEDSISESKLARWGKIIVSATQQSGRGDLMSLAPVVPLTSVLKSFSSTNRSSQVMGLFCYEGGAVAGGPPEAPKTWSLKEELQLRRSSPLLGLEKEKPEEVHLFIGSEGGFSLSEVELFVSHDLRPVSLGSQVLRVETACITLVSILKYEFDLMR